MGPPALTWSRLWQELSWRTIILLGVALVLWLGSVPSNDERRFAFEVRKAERRLLQSRFGPPSWEDRERAQDEHRRALERWSDNYYLNKSLGLYDPPER